MAQKFLEPFKKIPHQIQNLHLIQKLQGLTLGRGSESFLASLSSAYGCVEIPSAVAFDDKLGLFAVASKTGCIKVYGTPGVVFVVKEAGCVVSKLLFLPEEGRLLAALETGHVSLYELNTKNGRWTERSHVRALGSDQEQITALALGHGVVYVGSSIGTLYQLAVSNGRLWPGDTTLTSCTSTMVAESVPVEKRETLGVDSPIVALEVQPEGNHLLIAYAGGCVAVTIPQAIPQLNGTESASVVEPTTSAPTAEEEPATPNADESRTVGNELPVSSEGTETQEGNNTEPQSSEATAAPVQPSDSAQLDAPATPTKESIEKRATLKFKEFTRSLRRVEHKSEVETETPLPVPPAPRISHLLLRDQPVEWASWRVTAPEIQSNEITVAYGDGAYQIWPITAAPIGQELLEPIIVAKRDPPTTPYGPLPCGAIKKIIQHPGVNGSVITAFSGGLPRAEFQDRHAVSVLQDQEHHVCFQFGSAVKDFLFIPQKPVKIDETPVVTEAPASAPSAPQYAAALLVLTERELVVVDLTQPNWPTFQSPYLNCLDVSPVTAVTHLTKVSSALLNRLCAAVKCAQPDVTHSQWPIWGGENCNDCVDLAHNDENDVTVLGHANGWITLLAIGRGDTVHRLGTFHSNTLFNLSDSPNGVKCHNTIEVETWPPFRRVGDCALAHPLCVEHPDPRLAVTQLAAYITSNSITLVVGGAGGQVSMWTANEEEKPVEHFEPDVSVIRVNLIDQDATNPKYIWKGPPALRPFEGVAQMCASIGSAMCPSALIQLDPPAPVTSVAWEPSWNLLAVGSPHGFAVIDMLAKASIYTDFFYTKSATISASHKTSRPVSVSTMQTAIVNRGKQISATMRQSFRRLKHLRTSKSTDENQEAATSQPSEQAVDAEQTKDSSAEPALKPEETGSPSASQDTSKPEKTDEPAPAETEATPAEQITEIPQEPISLHPDEFGPSTVRSLLFADTYVISAVPATAQHPVIPSPRTPSIWVGTANGRVVAHSLNWEDTSGPVTVQLHKELQLQHHAPVLGLCVLDAASRTPVLSSPRIRTGCESQPKPEQTEVEPKPEGPKEGETLEVEGKSATAAAPAASASPLPVESHQLLLCSEEQVKLFQLPSLRAVHKHKFVDRIRLPGYTATTHTPNTAASTTTTEVAKTPKAEEITEKENQTEPVVEPEIKPVVAATQPHRKSLTAFGVQAFVRGTGDQVKTDWNVVVTRHDGQIVVLSIPHLRKLFKARSFVDPAICPVSCVSSLSSTNFVFKQAHCQLILTELSPAPRLCSAAVLTPGTSSPIQAAITLPEWARPHEPVPTESEASKSIESGVHPCTEDATVAETAPTTDAVNGSSDAHAAESADSAAPLVEKSGYTLPTGAPHAGDVTMDSIKEYLNGEGTVTVKTIETSSEKRTVVEGGQMVTTLHESERVDGKLIRDDVIKFSTDEPSTLTMTEAV